MENELKMIDENRQYTVLQRQALLELVGLKDQIEKEHWLNVHFRAFKLASLGWDSHILANAQIGSKSFHSPGGAVLDNERED